MQKHIPVILPVFALSIAIALFATLTPPATAASLTPIKNARLVPHKYNDGDSFMVDTGRQVLHLRLYFVDTPEAATYFRVKERILQQKCHFGLRTAGEVLEYGKRATEFTRAALSNPFTVYTAGKRVMDSKRYYAFIKTASGEYLTELLVKNGFARIYGYTRMTPDGTPRKIWQQHLRKLRADAIKNQRGIWQHSNPTSRFKKCKQSAADIDNLQIVCKPVNLNTATSQQLQAIKGIGKTIAARIIIHRPYRELQDLLRVPGIGEKKLETFAPCIMIADR